MARDISLLHPKVQEMVKELQTRCKSAGLNILITETFRTKSEQDTLYSKGRTTAGSIVTNAKYPYSFHCWGLAIDFCENIKGHEYDNTEFFTRVGRIAEDIGFEWGGHWTSFKDTPHLQYNAYGSTATSLVKTYKTPDQFKTTWSYTPNEVMDYKRLIQKALNTDGYSDANKNKLDVDGILGTKSLEALSKVNIFLNVIQKFALVTAVQMMLSELKYVIDIDGYYGEKSVEIIKGFQDKYKLSVNGIINKETILKLLELTT